MANPFKLVIVESPAKAKTISKFLGRGYKVEACNGHVRDLPKSQIGVDIDNNFEPRYITIRGRGEILGKIRKDAKAASRIYLATDPDREGEAISWHLAGVLGVDPASPCRIEFQEITSSAIKAAIKKPRPIDLSLVDAQQARRVLDRLVGYKISPLLWAKIRKGLSAGRVQSVATRMIVDREREIDAFIPEEYWTIGTTFTIGRHKLGAKFYGLKGEKAELKAGPEAERVLDAIKKQSYSVSRVKWGEKRKQPPAPFTTSVLQQEAVRQLGVNTRRAMQLAQQLYEGVDIEGAGTVGLISYIRTDSTRISAEMQESLRGHIAANYAPEYLPETPNQFKGRKGAQDAHEAIRITDLAMTPERVKPSLSRDQHRLYKMIYARTLASQMTPAVYDTLSVSISGGDAEFRFSGSKMKFPGFTVMYVEGQDEPEEKDVALPNIEEGAPAAIGEVESEQHFTQPPNRYTEASLVRALEEMGIGRPSTYAPTIGVILARGYVESERKTLHPTELGCVVNDMMTKYFDDIVDIQFTASLEEKLDSIEDGGVPWQGVVGDFYQPFAKELEIAEQQIDKVLIKDEPSDVVCDKCGATMVYKMGRYGKFLACPNFPECRNTMPILNAIETPCPKCGAKIIERTSKKGRKFYGCERYPDCDFISWDMPVSDKCEICGAFMTRKVDRKGAVFNICSNETCRHKVLVVKDEDADD